MAVTKSLLDLHTLNGFSSLLRNYLSGDEHLKSLYAFPPTIEGLSGRMPGTALPQTNRKLLAEVISEQYAASGISAEQAVSENINRLKESSTYTICTGHQLCLFTGPLYLIYKLISTINLAEKLGQLHPDRHFVPVYWMATEDHDFEEINHAHLFGKKLTWNKTEAEGSEEGSMPAGAISTVSLVTLLAELQVILGNSSQALELTALVNTAYGSGKSLADGTRSFVHALLGRYGLLILDPADPALKKEFIPFMEKELLERNNFILVNESIQELESLGYTSQVNPREINLFYISENKRNRIEKTAGKDEFKVVNTNLLFTGTELISLLKQYPGRFSPNVVLRPLYQQVLLPNLAYVGGPGELAYWLEYKKMFDHHQVPFPVLMPRNFVTWVDAGSSGKMKKLGIELAGLSHNLQDLEKDYVSKQLSDASKLNGEEEELRKVYTGIISKAGQIDPTLRALAESELQKLLNGLKNIESRLVKAEKQKHETALNQLKNLKEKLFPGGNLQERVDNFMPLYLRYGKEFIETLKQELNPFETKMILFTEA